MYIIDKWNIMNLDNYYWYFESALSDKQCDDIIEYVKSTSEKERAKIGLGTYSTTFPKTYSSLSSGNHIITIKDGDGCEKSYIINVKDWKRNFDINEKG